MNFNFYLFFFLKYALLLNIDLSCRARVIHLTRQTLNSRIGHGVIGNMSEGDWTPC